MSPGSHAYLGLSAGALALLAFVPYIRSIMRAETRPSRASWFIWAFVNAVTAAAYHASGAGATMGVALAYAAAAIIVAGLSIRYGEAGISKLDIACTAGAAASLAAWIVLQDAPSALYLLILTDCAGMLPTLRKAYLDPPSESRLAWTMSALAMALNLLAVDDWSLRISAYPVYCFASVALVAATLHIRGRTAGLPPLYVAKTARTGRGLYTGRAIRRGERAFVMEGTRRHYVSRTREDAHRFENWVGLAKDEFLDPAPPYLFINHSCGPNLGIRGEVEFVALRDIRAGEELTYDYAITTDERPWTMVCACGSPDCRKIIRSIHYLPQEAYARYLPLIGPYFKSLFEEEQSKENTSALLGP